MRFLADAGVEVVAQTPDADGLLGLIARHRPDAVVLDIRMPPTHTDEGIAAAAAIRIRSQAWRRRPLAHLESAWALRLVEEHPEGVGYLLKDRVVDAATIVDALRRVADG